MRAASEVPGRDGRVRHVPVRRLRESPGGVMRKWSVLLCVFVIAAALAAQEGERGPDGHYHDTSGDGHAQPDVCDNYERNPHPCECSRTSCDPKDREGHPSGGPNSGIKEGMPRCQTYCRTKACNCLNKCGS